jgi:hypothetical protein
MFSRLLLLAFVVLALFVIVTKPWETISGHPVPQLAPAATCPTP